MGVIPTLLRLHFKSSVGLLEEVQAHYSLRREPHSHTHTHKHSENCSVSTGNISAFTDRPQKKNQPWDFRGSFLQESLCLFVLLWLYLRNRPPHFMSPLLSLRPYTFSPKSSSSYFWGKRRRRGAEAELLPVSHLFPVNPCWHTQLLGETQVPPFWHNPSHIAWGRAEEKSYYSPRLTSINYVIRPAAAYVFAYRIRANLVMWFIMGARDVTSLD